MSRATSLRAFTEVTAGRPAASNVTTFEGKTMFRHRAPLCHQTEVRGGHLVRRQAIHVIPHFLRLIGDPSRNAGTEIIRELSSASTVSSASSTNPARYLSDPAIRRQVKAAAANQALSVFEYCVRAITSQLIQDNERPPYGKDHPQAFEVIEQIVTDRPTLCRIWKDQPMSNVITAVYTNGVFRPLEPVVLPDGAPVEIHVPEGPSPAPERLAALDAFDAMHEELTEEQWRVLEEAVKRRPWFGRCQVDL